MLQITKDEYEKIHKDYRGTFQNYQNIKSMEHLIGRRTMLLKNNGGLGIEGIHFTIKN